MTKKVNRLFRSFQPQTYDLNLDLRPDEKTFSGRVKITGKRIGRPSERFTFHQKELSITSAIITKHSKTGDEAVKIVRINNQNTLDEVRLHVEGLIYPGNYTVELEFNGKITRQMNGIYPCFFKKDNKEQTIIATQFESHHAREAFPCIDEPEAKAIFSLCLDTPKVETVLSNTEPTSQKEKAGRLTTTFESTPRMSTYLLAFIVGDLKYLQSKTSSGVIVRTYATEDNVAYTKFALDCAVKTLEFYDDYFGIAYPLSKCDFIALPDFASGAMENWGCITFREQALLVDPKNTSLTLKQYVANVVAHELTHQWFGNLVTMRWWTDLWLNESFASWMSYLAVDHLYPEWKVWTQFIVDEQGLALKHDALEHTHPIEVTVNHPDEIRTIFDVISYEKGASVITMLHDYLGAEDFKKGIQLYLKEHAYSNTDTIDLWDALEQASSRQVKQFMGAWTSLSGYPVVKMSQSEDDDSILLSQERFYLNPVAKKTKSVWPIPLLTEMTKESSSSLNKVSSTLLPSDFRSNYLLNKGRKGFYRVIYSKPILEDHINNGGIESLSDVDRLGLLSDAMEASKAGYLPTIEALDLLKHYTNESSVVVWEIIAGALGSMRLVMDDNELRTSMKPFVRNFVSSQLERLGWDETDKDSHFDRLLRPIILGMAAVADEPSVTSEVRRLFDEHSADQQIEPDLRGVVYSTISRLGDEKDFNKLLKLHNDSNSSEERLNLCAALTGFEQPKLIDRALQTITSDDVRLQDVSYWISYAFLNYHARPQAWQWVLDNWKWLEKNLGTDLSFYRLPNYIARCYSDLEFLEVYKKFFNDRLGPAFDRPLKQGIETIEWQAAWRGRDLTTIKHFFK